MTHKLVFFCSFITHRDCHVISDLSITSNRAICFSNSFNILISLWNDLSVVLVWTAASSKTLSPFFFLSAARALSKQTSSTQSGWLRQMPSTRECVCRLTRLSSDPAYQFSVSYCCLCVFILAKKFVSFCVFWSRQSAAISASSKKTSELCVCASRKTR